MARCRGARDFLQYRPVGAPHYGGHIERLIGTMMGAAHLLPGSTFSNIKDRGDYASVAKSAMTLDELERWLALEITRYHAERHRSLGITTLGAQPILSLQWGKPAPDTIDSVQDYVGPDRFNYVETAGKFQEAGARIAFGSDWPVDGLNEWYAMEVALTRENGVNPDPVYAGRLGDDPGLDLRTALRAFTINAAYSLDMDQHIGSIEPGKLADLIVIDRDLFQVDPKTISDTTVLLTMVGGHEVYRADGFVDQ